jgi:hypothetical protein
MDPNRPRHGYRYNIVYEFTSHISGATVLTPLTLVPSCVKNYRTTVVDAEQYE